jgi:hypothetical protein
MAVPRVCKLLGEDGLMWILWIYSRNGALAMRAEQEGRIYGYGKHLGVTQTCTVILAAQAENVFRFAATADTLRPYPDAGTGRPRRTPAPRYPLPSTALHSLVGASAERAWRRGDGFITC